MRPQGLRDRPTCPPPPKRGPPRVALAEAEDLPFARRGTSGARVTVSPGGVRVPWKGTCAFPSGYGAPPMRGKVAVFALSLQFGIFTLLLGKEKALKFSKLRFFFYALGTPPAAPTT